MAAYAPIFGALLDTVPLSVTALAPAAIAATLPGLLVRLVAARDKLSRPHADGLRLRVRALRLLDVDLDHAGTVRLRACASECCAASRPATSTTPP